LLGKRCFLRIGPEYPYPVLTFNGGDTFKDVAIGCVYTIRADYDFNACPSESGSKLATRLDEGVAHGFIDLTVSRADYKYSHRDSQLHLMA
jgi:hypothetical protein